MLSHTKDSIANDYAFMLIYSLVDRRYTKAVTIMNLVMVVRCILFKDCSSVYAHVKM